MNRSRFFTVCAFALGGIVFLFAQDTYADQDVYIQSLKHDAGTALGNGYSVYQKLGTGLTGALTAFQLYGSASTTQNNFSAVIFACDDSQDLPFTGTCTNLRTYTSANIEVSTIPQFLYFSTTEAVILNSTKYYWIAETTNPDDVVSFYGTKTNAWAGGNAECVQGGNNIDCGVNDFYFDLIGIQTNQNESYISVVQPLQNGTTTSASVTFKFNYHAAVGSGIDFYRLNLSDTLSTTIIPIQGTASEGDHTVEVSLDLNLGHKYYWQPRIGDTESHLLWGTGIYLFYVGATTTPYGQGYATTTTVNDFITEIAKGELPNCSVMTHNNSILTALSRAFPFSYLFDLCDVVQELYQSTTTNSLSIGIPSFQGKNATTSFFVFSENNDTVQKFSGFLRTPLRYMIWILAAIYLPSMVIGGI